MANKIDPLLQKKYTIFLAEFYAWKIIMKEWIVIHKVKSLHNNGEGLSQREIAKKLGISRNTVRKYLSLDESTITQMQINKSRIKSLDEYQTYILHLLQTYPNLSSVKITRKLREKIKDFDISERTIRRYVEQLKKVNPVKQARYYEPILNMIPGQQCQVDPGELHDVIVNGKKTKIYFVVFVLSYSRLLYVGASQNPINTEIMIKMHDAAFHYFGGCPEECVYDQGKTVVVQEEFRELVLNNQFARYATYAGFKIRSCEGYDPESKGKVEAGVKYVKNNGFYGETFANMDDLHRYLADWVDNIANKRLHSSTKRVPQEHFEVDEKKHLKPYQLSDYQYQYGTLVTRKADKTGLISWSGNKYSVPMSYQSTHVGVKEDEQFLVIFDVKESQEIARHRLSLLKGQTIKNSKHYRDIHELTRELETKLSDVIGQDIALELCQILKKTSPHIYKDQVRGALKVLQSFLEPVDKEIILKLCRRPHLTVTFLRDYLQAYMSKKRKHEENQSSPNPLNTYAQLVVEGGSNAIH